MPSVRIPGLRLNYARSLFAPVLITVVLLGAHLSFGILDSYDRLLAAVGTAVATDLVLCRLVRGYWRDLSSAYTSGISVGILIRSPFVWPYVLASLLTISSKYVLTYQGRHVWNPSNFGICVMLFAAQQAVAPLSVQWGNDLWPMLGIWIIGLIALWEIGRIHISATYVASFTAFAAVRAWIHGNPFLTEFAPLSGPMYQLFVFFMITDPMTTVRTRWAQYAVPFLIALVEFGLRLDESIYAPFYALFLVGPVAMALEIWWRDLPHPAESN